RALLHGMLSFLLFAGALHVDVNRLRQQRWVIALLAVGGVILSTFIIGLMIWKLFAWLGIRLSLIYSLLFGALISPTDPIAVLGILKKAGIPKRLEVKIVGESLFNDGIGVVLFVVLLELATGARQISAGHILGLFAEEALGGILLGYSVGLLACWLLRQVDNYQVEILITLAVVTGGYALADAVHFSGPITVVIAGLLIGNHGRLAAMSERTREHLDTFWELVDEILNAILFVLIGLQVLVVPYKPEYLTGGLLTIPVVLLARLISVGVPINALRSLRAFTPNAVMIMTWGGLRGGISVALALSLPPGTERDIIITMTYIVVVFSILVQGLSLGKLLARR
ncbi:MAG TPA: sodium:proton antiporter, partial [Gammaproteobacteria bacterium]|nr:sodium:proton antiporter [Gammaproteobacteria bacterium]